MDYETGERVETPARVLLLGMGIDEQLGGYSRHRTRYAGEDHAGLEEPKFVDVGGVQGDPAAGYLHPLDAWHQVEPPGSTWL